MSNEKLGLYDSDSLTQEQMDEFFKVLEEIMAPRANISLTIDPTAMKLSIENELLEQLKNECSVVQRELIIVDAFMKDRIDVKQYKDLIEKSAAMINLPADFLGLPTRKKSKECDCGAKHTSFPKHHYYWCSVKAK